MGQSAVCASFDFIADGLYLSADKRADLRGTNVSAQEPSESYWTNSHGEPMTQTAPGMLKAFVERIERLNEERKALSDDVSDIYKEAKANGFDVPTLKLVIRRREKDPNALTEQEALIQTYEAALGTPVATRERDASAEQEAA